MGCGGIYIETLSAFCQMCVGYKTLSLMMILLIDYIDPVVMVWYEEWAVFG